LIENIGQGLNLIATKKILSGLMVLAFCIFPLSASPQGSKRWSSDAVLTMMDHSAQDFHSLTANIERIKYTDVVKDTSTETGQLWVRKDDKMRIQITKPDPRTVLRTGDSLFIFNPKINRVEEYDLGKNREMVDQYMELGFNTRSESLKKSYLVAVNGEQELDGRKTVLIELTPKSQKVREQITKIQMWVDTGSWMPVQQKFFEANSGDYFIIHYTGIMKNLKIEDSRFKPDWPKNVAKVKPRG
jgi:outer membrane lipoprotein-sorting protein